MFRSLRSYPMVVLLLPLVAAILLLNRFFQLLPQPEEEQKYESQTRGTVQKRYQDVINEPNIVLSYYSHDLSLRRTNYYQLLPPFGRCSQ